MFAYLSVCFACLPRLPVCLAAQDLKSPNILVDDRWRIKITDFGLSRARQHTLCQQQRPGGGLPGGRGLPWQQQQLVVMWWSNLGDDDGVMWLCKRCKKNCFKAVVMFQLAARQCNRGWSCLLLCSLLWSCC